MTVAELITKLQALPQDLEVWTTDDGMACLLQDIEIEYLSKAMWFEESPGRDRKKVVRGLLPFECLR